MRTRRLFIAAAVAPLLVFEKPTYPIINANRTKALREGEVRYFYLYRLITPDYKDADGTMLALTIRAAIVRQKHLEQDLAKVRTIPGFVPWNPRSPECYQIIG
jgi:hypothetical protein